MKAACWVNLLNELLMGRPPSRVRGPAVVPVYGRKAAACDLLFIKIAVLGLPTDCYLTAVLTLGGLIPPTAEEVLGY